MPKNSTKLKPVKLETTLKKTVKKAASITKKAAAATKKATSSVAKKSPIKLKLPKFKLPIVKPRPDTIRPKLTESDLINAESALGGTIFGKIPAGHRREFFRFKDNIWIYHENWTENGKTLESTITYEVKETGVFKSPLGKEYVKIEGTELDNFLAAARAYLTLIKKEIY